MNAPTPDALFADYLKNGDAERFAQLHDLLRDELLRTAERLAPSRSAAEDLVQSTFLGALESAGRFERGRKVVPWLYGILQNQARMMRWRAARAPDPHRVAWPAPSDPAALAADREFAEALAGAFVRLGPTYAPVMELHLRDEMSAQDIGKQLDRPAGTVRTQVVRGAAMLRSLLPAGVASLLLVRVTPGMDAIGVRQQLLDHATRGPVAAARWLPIRVLGFAVAGLFTTAIAWFVFGPAMLGVDRAPSREQRATANPGERAAGASVSARADVASTAPVERSLVASPATSGLTVLVTHEGAPVPAVPVCVMALADWRFHRHLQLSDANGRAHFADLPAGRALVLPQAERNGRDDAMLELEPGKFREHQVALERRLTFEARVVDERGAPLAGAEVWLADGDFQNSFGFGAQRVLAADAHGSFVLATATRHRFTHVQVTAPGFRASGLHPLPRERGEQHTFVLAPNGEAVLGSVVDSEGAPLAGVLVRAVHAGERSRLAVAHSDGTTTSFDSLGAIREVRTDANGQFALGGFDRGAMVALKVWEAAWARHDATVSAGAPPITVTLTPAATVHGRVIDQDGKPVVDAEVCTETDDHDPMTSHTRTSSDGGYTLAGVTPGEAVAVTVTSLPDPVDGTGGAGNATTQLRLEPGRRHVWNPVLTPGTTFRGTLRSEDGSPLDGWTFDIVAIDEIAGRNNFPVRLDAAGAFEVKNVPRARYWLQFRRDNCMPMQYVVFWPLAERYDIVVPERVARRALQVIQSWRSPKPPVLGTIEIDGLGTTSDVGFYLFAVDGGGTWNWVGSGVEWDAARSRWAASLAPGRYELVVFSIQWSRKALATVDQTLPFVITAGQSTVLRPQLQPGVRRCFRIDEPSPHLGANSAFAEVRDAAGRLVSRWLVPRWFEPAPGRFEASVALAPGMYRIEVETELGHRGALDFTVDSLVPFPEVVPLPVR